MPKYRLTVEKSQEWEFPILEYADEAELQANYWEHWDKAYCADDSFEVISMEIEEVDDEGDVIPDVENFEEIK